MKNPRSFSHNRFLSHLRIASAGTLITTGVITMLTLMLGGTMTTSVGAASAQSAGFYTGHVSLSGTSSPQTGYFAPSNETGPQVEFPGQVTEPDGSPGPFPGSPVNRSLSKGVGRGVAAAVGKALRREGITRRNIQRVVRYEDRGPDIVPITSTTHPFNRACQALAAQPPSVWLHRRRSRIGCASLDRRRKDLDQIAIRIP